MKAKSGRTYRGLSIALIAALVVSAVPPPAAACTRVLYVAKDGTVITGRSMDWGEDMHSNMWVLPRGMKRDGMGGKNTVTWESKYGSLIVSALRHRHLRWHEREGPGRQPARAGRVGLRQAGRGRQGDLR